MSNLSSLITQTVGSSAGGVNLITAPSSASIWTATGGVTVTTTTTAAELPLEGFSSTAVKFALSASVGTAYCDFDCPTALQNFLLQLLWYSRASSAFTASITLSINSYSSSGNRTSNTSPTVVTPQVSAIIGAGINFETNFLSTSNQYLRLTLSFGAQASAWYSIAQLSIGPSNRTQGPAIEDWKTSTFTIDVTTNATTTSYYQRIGPTMLARLVTTFSGASNAGTGCNINMPAGLTINTTVYPVGTQVGSARFYDDSAAQYINGTLFIISTSAFRVRYFDDAAAGVQDVNTTAGGPFTIAANDVWTFEFAIPINEWAGSALNLGQGAQEYYMSNSGTTTTSGATNPSSSTVYGPAGQPILSINSTALSNTTTFRMTPLYPIQNSDTLILETSNDGIRFIPVATNSYNIDYQGTSYYGMGITYISSTEVYVEFGNGGFRGNNATYGLAGQAWSALAGSYWRVRVCKASSPVGFGLASSTSAGLLNYYSEGTWTPTYQGNGGSAGAAAYTSTGVYTRIGRTVTCYGRITLTNVGSWTSYLKIRGLPFTAAASQYFGGAVAQWANLTTPIYWMGVLVVGNDTEVQLLRTSVAAVSAGNLTIADLSNTSLIDFSFTYQV